MLKTPLEDYVPYFPFKPLAFKIGFWAQVFHEDHLVYLPLGPEDFIEYDKGVNEAYWAQLTDAEPAGENE